MIGYVIAGILIGGVGSFAALAYVGFKRLDSDRY